MQVEAPIAARVQENPITPESIYSAPENTGEFALNRTLISLLDEALQNNPNDKAFNQKTASGWQASSTKAFKSSSEYIALALNQLDLNKGERVGLFCHSDISFCLADMACLMAGLVNVPIYLTHAPKSIKHILNQSEAKALMVSDAALLKEITSLIAEVPSLKTIILWATPETLPEMPSGISFYTFADLETQGKKIHEADNQKIEQLKTLVQANDLATLIYTSGTTGLPKGVMLSHENISSNVIASLTGMHTLARGKSETAIAFLPLTHIFARALHYGLMWYGISVYFSDPDTLREDLQSVKPTYFASVPRVLEKAFERIMATGSSLTGIKKSLFDWSMSLAARFDVSQEPTGFYALQLKLADKLVFSKWRDALGGNIKRMSVGGAALRPDLVNTFGAAGIDILQGYGLTETSPVITFNRPGRNKAGTVGEVLTGVEVTISSQGEILARGPNIMQGYYQNPEKTAEVLQDGWFHTGDLGEFEGGYLKITGRIKNLFKLSTGKYVMPQPLEERLESDPLISAALVVGEGEKYCSALLFISPENFGSSDITKLEQSEVDDNLKVLLQSANQDLPHWSSVKRVAIILEDLTVENGMLTPKMSVKRNIVLKHYSNYIENLYGQAEHDLAKGLILDI